MFLFHSCCRYRCSNSTLKVKGLVFMGICRDSEKKSYDRYMQGTYDRDLPRLDIYIKRG